MTVSRPNREVHGVFLHETELDDLSQAHTVLRARDELREQGVHLDCHATGTGRGVAASVRDDHEFILATAGHSRLHHPPLETVLSVGLPTFVFARGPASSVGTVAARLLADDRVTSIIRNANLADPTLNNLVSEEVKHRYHTCSCSARMRATSASRRERCQSLRRPLTSCSRASRRQRIHAWTSLRSTHGDLASCFPTTSRSLAKRTTATRRSSVTEHGRHRLCPP